MCERTETLGSRPAPFAPSAGLFTSPGSTTPRAIGCTNSRPAFTVWRKIARTAVASFALGAITSSSQAMAPLALSAAFSRIGNTLAAIGSRNPPLSVFNARDEPIDLIGYAPQRHNVRNAFVVEIKDVTES